METKTEYPWKQQPNEPKEIFKMFNYYLEITEGRSYKTIATVFGKGDRSIDRYGKKWNWVQRAELYDKHIHDTYKLSLIDFCKEFEEKKFSLKVDLSFLSFEIAESLKNYLNHFELIYKNPDVQKRLKFFREISRTIKQVFSMSDFSLNADMLEAKLLRDINHNNSQESKNTTLILNDNKSINLSINSVLKMIKEKSGKSTAIGANNSDESPNSNDDNDYPKLDLAAIYAIEAGCTAKNHDNRQNENK